MSEILTILTNQSFISVKWKSVHVLVIIVNIDNMHGEKLKIHIYFPNRGIDCPTKR